MAIDSDSMADRRRLKRRLALWRLLAFAAVAALIAVSFDASPRLPGMRHIAAVTVDGIILGDRPLERAIRDLADDQSVAAMIVHIDSPGGTTFASEALYRAILAVGETRPVVAVLDGVAASGAYMAALAADHIVARKSTVTGSIGVVFQAMNFAGLMEKLGVEGELVRSGPLKAEPNPFGPMPPEARAATRRVVDSLHDMFVAMVAERRELPAPEASRLADGRVYTGAMAVESGLIDGLGGLEEAVVWLEEEAGVTAGLPINDVQIDRPQAPIDRLISLFVGKSVLTERLGLDGPVSLWHSLAAD